MRNSIFLLALLLNLHAFGQQYWQQEVNYTISVTLDDVDHKITGYEEFVYTNNSPNALTEMYIHLWPNAYRDGNSALGKQLYRNGEMALTYGLNENKGNIDDLKFNVDGQMVQWKFDEKNKDICVITLNKPLQPDGKIKVSTPFTVKIPSGEISRLGHIDQSYQITQWYPKPAVYDKNGWNAIPYLNQGEFYSEYGSFDVSITLPANYVVGATGDLQTESEKEFLAQKVEETKAHMEEYLLISESTEPTSDFPPSSKETKTIRYTQSNLHDFAWFADKRYAVSMGEVILPQSKRRVKTWAMWVPENTSLWQYADEYLRDGTYYYSLWNGDYPYNNVTAVDGTISAGGGMEYPNITVIGNASSAEELEVVIVHEVGHNWFYGILGSNERVHGWMDEGMNTLNEIRYVQTKYPDNTRLSDMVLNGRFHFDELDHHDQSDFFYRLTASFGEDQPIETRSEEFTQANYATIMYSKTGLVFYYLKDYLGEELFDKCMHAYFEEWKFKHPQPEDMRATLERVSGKDLTWLFVDLIQTTNHIDYKIKSVKTNNQGTTVKVKNVGQVNGPIEVSITSGEDVFETTWIEPSAQRNTTIQMSTPDAAEVHIDVERDLPEIYRDNNNWHAKGLFGKKEKFNMEFLIGDNDPKRNTMYWTPIVAGNAYDKFMVGGAFHNMSLPFSKFQYLVAPMYSVGRNMVSGMAELAYTCLPATGLKQSKFGLSLKSFKNDNQATTRKQYGVYLAISPYWTAKIGNRLKNSPLTQTIQVQGIAKGNFATPEEQVLSYAGGFVKYDLNLSYPDHKFNIQLRQELLRLRGGQWINRTMGEVNYAYRYARYNMKRWVEIRGFVGRMNRFTAAPIAMNDPYGLSLSGTNGAQDLFFEDYYFARGPQSGMWSQQRNENMGGFKSTSGYGTTYNWMATTNIYFQLPIPTFGIFGVYADLGAFSNGFTVNTAINTGLAVRFGKVFGVYFPIWMSKELNDSFNGGKYGEKIRFTLKMNLVNQSGKLFSLIN